MTWTIFEIEKNIRWLEREVRNYFPRRNRRPGARKWLRHCIKCIREWERIERTGT